MNLATAIGAGFNTGMEAKDSAIQSWIAKQQAFKQQADAQAQAQAQIDAANQAHKDQVAQWAAQNKLAQSQLDQDIAAWKAKNTLDTMTAIDNLHRQGGLSSTAATYALRSNPDIAKMLPPPPAAPAPVVTGDSPAPAGPVQPLAPFPTGGGQSMGIPGLSDYVASIQGDYTPPWVGGPGASTPNVAPPAPVVRPTVQVPVSPSSPTTPPEDNLFGPTPAEQAKIDAAKQKQAIDAWGGARDRFKPGDPNRLPYISAMGIDPGSSLGQAYMMLPQMTGKDAATVAQGDARVTQGDRRLGQGDRGLDIRQQAADETRAFHQGELGISNKRLTIYGREVDANIQKIRQTIDNAKKAGGMTVTQANSVGSYAARNIKSLQTMIQNIDLLPSNQTQEQKNAKKAIWQGQIDQMTRMQDGANQVLAAATQRGVPGPAQGSGKIDYTAEVNKAMQRNKHTAALIRKARANGYTDQQIYGGL